ncbi:MAG TPA: hypothetical protein VGO07_01930, partial [Candidatus Saccharimonadales bacterium]|nr:hypothetical protein [Candidatus Saccharimonadales bacterium]
MDDQNQYTSTTVNPVAEGIAVQPLPDIGVAAESLDMGVEALSLDPSALGKPPPDNFSAEGLKSRNPFAKLFKAKLFKRADVVLVLLLVGSMVGLLINTQSHKNKQAAVSSVITQYGTQHIPLNGFVVETQGGINFAPSDVTINGALNVSAGLVLTPSVQPNTPTAGQLYYDHNTNQLAYYNGTGFVALTQQGAIVQNIGGATGAITLGGGLSVVNNQLTAALPSGVSSVGGISGAVTIGTGLKVVGSDIQNSGLLSIVPGTPNLVVGSDGNGNVTISSVGGGSGTVTSSGGTVGRIGKFTGVQNVENSLLSDDGTTVTANGNLSVTGSLLLSTVLPVASGGTGVASLPADSVVIGQGASALAGVVAPSAGLCLISTAGAPSFQSCSGTTGVSSVNGLTGNLTISNATGSVNTITIDDASTIAKGIASFNGTNFTVTGGAVNTAQNITTSSTPTFAGVNTNNVTPSSALTIGVATQSLSLLGSASSVFSVTGGGQTTNVGFAGVPAGSVNYNFDRSAAAGTYNICTTAANCSGIGGSVTTSGGTTNRLSKFTGGQVIGDSSISDNGSVVTVNGTANLVVQGGTATLGTLSQAGSLVLSDGASHTVTIMTSGLSADRVYTLPDAGGNATLCVNSGNCIGGTGAAPNAAEYLVASLNGTLTNERALAGGSNISLTDGGANATMTVATVQNPTFTTSVTTPILQSSGALTITSAAGTTVAIDAGTTIELQDSTNVTGSLDVSAAFTSGTANAFQVNAAGAIAAATGITSSGTITFSGLNCTGNLNGGALTTNASGQLMCSDDDGGSASAITGSGSSGTVPLFNGAQTITNSIITQSGTTITIAGDLTLNTALSVANGGTGATSLTARGLLYGNGAGAVQVTSAGTGGQVLIANGSGVPVFASFSGDVAVSNTGATTIQPDSVALGTDTTGSYVANLGLLTGLSASGNSGEGSTPTLSVTYGAIANTAVQGNVTLTCPSGAGNLTGGGNGVTLGAGGSCNNINIVNNPSFTTSVTTPAMILTGAGSNGTIQVANLGQGTVYTLPDPGGAAATICISTGNCSAAGSAGGDLTGSYPNPAIAKLQGTNLTITSPAAGHVLVYNATNSAWENHAIIGDIAISETGVSTVQANAVALGTDTTGNYVLGLTAGNGVNITGSAGEGWSPTVAVIYGNSANTAVQGNTSISVSAGTNLTGGGSITLGAGGAVTLNVASSPTFSGTLAVQGATATIGTSSQQGSVVLNDGSSNTATVQTAALAQNTTYTLPDPGGATATICLTTGNCSGAGGGVTTGGGTTNRVSKFTGSQTLGDSSISDNGSVVTINGTANFVVQGGTGTFGTLTQAGTLAVSDGSSNTVSVVAAGLAADRIYTLPDAGSNATFCLDTGNCIGSGGGGAPNNATYLLTSLNGTLSNERALANGSNIAFTDAGANGNFTVATVQNPTFTTSVTTPILQSSGALTITSAAGTTVAISAGTTIELQNSTNVTGSLDVSASFTSGTSDAFQVSSGGAITAVTGITSSGTVTFSGLNCTTFTNGGALTTNASGQLQCSNDDGGAGGAVSGSGTSGTIPVFTGTNTIADSIVTQASTTITIAGDLVLSTALSVANGGTGATSFTSHSLLYGNGTGVVQVTNVGTGGQVLIANASGIPTFASFSGDVAVSNTGVTTIQADSVALGTDTVGNYVSLLGTLTGLTTTGNTGEGSTPTLAVTYGSGANTAVQGNTSLTCASGTGNLSGGGNAVTLGSGGSCNNLTISNSPTFSTSVTTPSMILTGAGSNGILQIANLGQATTYTLPDPGGATATICLTTGNCTAIGAAGGDLTGSYPNPTIAKLQSGTLTISSVASGNLLQYNGSAWVNQSISGDITLNSSAVATIGTGKVNSGNILDNTIVNTDLASGSFGNITGVGTLGALTVTGAANINSAGSANTAIGNATGTFQVASNGLNVSAGGALTGVAGITTSGGYTQSGAVANTLTGATSLTAAGTALSVTNNATISGTLTTNTISPNSALTVGDAGQSFTLQGNGTSTIKSTDTGNTTILDFTTPIANTTLHLPALGTGAYTLCTSSGNCGGVGATLQTAYTNSTNPEIVLDATRGALTVRDTSGGLGANLLEVQNNTGSTTYFNVTAAGINTTGTNVSSGNVNTTGGTIQTNSTDRISNGGNLVNIGTITTTGAINTQTISSAANFTGTVTIQGTNALTLGTASTNTGAIIFKGSGGAGVLTLTGPATPNAGNFSLSIPAITANANLCTDNSICAGYAPSSGSANYANAALSNLASVAINAALGFQANQAANINFAAAAATTGNTLNITGQTAGGAANNGGDVTVQGGTGTTTGTGGTTAVRGGNAAATGTNGTLTLDAGTGATVANGTINIGAANASTINVGTNNTLTSTIQIGAAAQSAGTQTVNVGNSNTAGGTTIVVIGSGSSAAGGTTTVRAKGALTVTGGAASTWDVNGILSLQTTNNGAITTGTGLWTQGGNLTFNGTTARTITGPGTGGLTVTVAAGPLALSTTGSGTLAVTSAGALNLTGAAASTLNVGANTFALTSSNVNVTAGGVLTTTSAVLQGTNALTLGTASTNTGAIIFKGSGGAGTLTVAGPAIPNAGNFTLTIPAITANANVCTDNSVCAGYAPSSGSGSYANTALSNLASVAINAALGFQSNQTATINFNGTAAAGNALNITGQTATGGNGGNIAVTGGTGVGGGNLGGSVTIQGGNAGATGINGSVTVDTGSGATTSNGTVSIGTTNANTVTIGNTANNTIVNIQAGNGFTTSTGQINIGTTSKSTIAIGSTSTAGNSVSIESGSTNSIAIGNSGTTHTILIGVNSSAGSTNTITLGNFDNVASSTAIRGGNDAT